MGSLTLRHFIGASLFVLFFLTILLPNTAEAYICFDPYSVDEPTDGTEPTKGNKRNKENRGEGNNSNDYQVSSGSCDTDEPPPKPGKAGTPSVSSVNSTSGSYTVSWTAASNMITSGSEAWGYQLVEYRNGSVTQTYTTSPTTTSYSVSSNSDGNYQYKVRGCNLDFNMGTPVCGSYSSLSSTNYVRHKPSTPAAPSISSSTSTGSVTVSWTKPSGAVSFYRLQKRVNGGSWTWANTNVSSTSTSVSSLTNGSWDFRVQACNGYSWACSSISSDSANVTVKVPPSTPVAPSIESSTSTGSVKVNWSKPSGTVTFYRLQKRINGGSWNWANSNVSDTSYTVTGLTNGTWDFRVRACNGDTWSCSSYSSDSADVTVKVPPSTPAVPSISSTTSTGSVTVSWSKPSGTVSFYRLQRRLNSGSWNPVWDVDINDPDGAATDQFTTTSHADQNLTDGSWDYRVQACNDVWSCSSYSSASAKVKVRVPPGTPAKPTPETLSSTTGAYSVSWGAPSGTVTKYYIREFKNDYLYSTNSTTARTYDYEDRANGSYTYQVRACNEEDWACSAYSDFSLAVAVSHTPGWGGDGGDVDDSTYGYVEGDIGDYNVGALEGQPGVSGGAATYHIPIVLPPGRKGMQPNISLNYSSRSGNGIAGMGWSLSAGSSIHRCSATVAQDGYSKGVTFSTEDKLCLDGQRLIAVNGSTYGATGAEYRTEMDSFARIKQYGGINSGASFTVEHKNNRTSYYGDTSDSQHIPEGRIEPLSWAISKQQDASGNSIDYHYQSFGHGEYHLQQIVYTGFGSNQGNRKLMFGYEARQDSSRSFNAGGLTLNTKRLASLKTFVGGVEVRSYKLFYKYSTYSKRSLLEYIEECASNQCLPATKFDVYEPELQWDNKDSSSSANQALPEFEGDNGWAEYMDLNGDGLPELLYNALTDEYAPFGWGTTIYGRDKRTGQYERLPFEDNGKPLFTDGTGDLNGDGIVDFFLVDQSNRVSLGQFAKDFKSTAAETTNITMPASFVRNKTYYGQNTLQILDLNGDGYQDFLFIDDTRTIQAYFNKANGALEFTGPYALKTLDLYTYDTVKYQEAISFMDVDGDGVPDLIRTWQNDITNIVINIDFARIDENGRWVVDESRNADQMKLPPNLYHNQHVFADLNGDGLKDFVWPVEVSDGVFDWRIRENRGDRTFAVERSLGTGTGIHKNNFLNAKRRISTRVQALWGGLRVGDLDNDGVDELLVATGSDDTVCVLFTGSPQQNTPEPYSGEVCNDDLHASHADMTSHPIEGGFVKIPIDWADYDTRRFNWSVLDFKQTVNGPTLNQEIPNVVQAPIVTFAVIGGGRVTGLKLEDVDNNGTLDFSYNMLTSYGKGTRAPDEYITVAGVDYYQAILRMYFDESSPPVASGYFEQKNLMGLGADLGKLADTNYQVENGLGETFKWSYAPLSRILSDRKTGNAFYNVPDIDNRYVENDPKREHFYFTSSMYVVSNSYQSNGTDQVNEDKELNETQYNYREAVYNRAGRGFQGFRTVIVDDIESGIRSVSDFHQIFPLAGKLEKTRSCLLQNGDDSCQGNVLSESNYSWDIWRDGMKQLTVTTSEDDFSSAVLGGGGNNRYWAAPQSQTSTSYQTTSSPMYPMAVSSNSSYTKTVTNSHDQYGNTLTSAVVEDNGFQITQKNKINTFDYNYVTDWWINKIKSTSVTTKTLSQSGAAPIKSGTDTDKSSGTQYSYDSDGHVHRISTGTSTTASGTSESYVHSTTISLNGYGLPKTVTQQGYGNSNTDLNRVVTTTYSDDGYFPKTVTNDAGHISTTEVNLKHGQPDWVTDANENKVTYTYDSFGRVESATVPGGKIIESGYRWCDPYCSGAPDTAVYYEFNQQEGSPTVKTYKDMFNRTVMTETLGFDGSPIYTSVEYDRLGRKTLESIPSTNSLNEKGTHYKSYDLLGRLLSKETDRENGNTYYTSYNHSGHVTSIEVVDGSRTLSMKRTYGGDGKLIETSYDNSGIADYAVTRYAYDSMGNPITLEDANGNSIHAWHNGFGHKWMVEDPNMGVKTFDYNTFGEVEQEIDANNNKLTMRYDGLGRLTHRFVNDSETAQAHYTYDTRFKGKGLPATEVGEGIQKDFYYDEHSRPNRQVTTIDGTPYETLTEYDANFGRVKAVQYPGSGIKVGYGYNDFGYQTSTFNADSGFVYQEVTARDAFMNIVWALKNNGTLAEERNYSEVTGQLYSVEVTGDSKQLHFLDYEYTNFGNLHSQTVQYNNGSDFSSEFYTYDDLHRLTDSYRTFSNSHSETPIEYGYDLVGNLEKKSDYASTINYGATGKANAANAGPSAIKSIIKNGTLVDDFEYDANGNLKQGDGKTISYNAFNKPVSISKGGINSSFAYGADLMRFKQVKTGLPDGEQTTIYLDKMVEIVKQGGSTITRTYIDDVAIISKEEIVGQPLADHKIRFTLRDRLGSVVTLTDHNNHIMEHRSYDPFGKPRTGDLMDVAVPTLREAALSDPHSGDFMDDVPFTNRGFTDHEHLDDAELIHMNGRAYDYNLGRFLSVDPFIQSPGNSQSMNPYSYIMNNPLAGIDPSGYLAEDPGCGLDKFSCGDNDIFKFDPWRKFQLGASRDSGAENSNSSQTDTNEETEKLMERREVRPGHEAADNLYNEQVDRHNNQVRLNRKHSGGTSVPITGEGIDPYSGDNSLRSEEASGDTYVEVSASQKIGARAKQINGIIQGTGDVVDTLVTPDETDLAVMATAGPIGVIANKGKKISRMRQSSKDKGPDIPYPDATGRSHDIIPSHVPSEWNKGQVQDAIDGMRKSIQERKRLMRKLGEDPGHTERLRREENFLRQLNKRADELD